MLPGLGPSAAIAVLLPLTFGADPLVALVALAGIYYGAMYGGTITSVMLNVPGESASVVTTYDGYPMARQGRGGAALGVAAVGSFVAGTIGLVFLSVLAVPLSTYALAFGPPEYFAVMVLAFVIASTLARENMIKCFLALFLGLLLSTVGQDVVGGETRLTWGSMKLVDGVGFIPAVVGMFGLAELIYDLIHPSQFVDNSKSKIRLRDLFLTWEDFRRTFGSMVRGGLLGFFAVSFPVLARPSPPSCPTEWKNVC